MTLLNHWFETPVERIDRLILEGCCALDTGGNIAMWCYFCEAPVTVHDRWPQTHEEITAGAWRYNDHIHDCPNNPYSDNYQGNTNDG